MNDTTIKSYFLGELAAAEAELLEDQTAGDGDLAEQAQLVEAELIDDYLRGTLGAIERRAFENVYLTTEARRAKLESAKNLWRIANLRETPEIAIAPFSWRQLLFGSPRRLAFAGLILAAIAGTGLFLLLKKDRTEIARTENAPVAVSETNHSSQTNAENTTKETPNKLPDSAVNLAVAPNNAAAKKSPAPQTEVKPTPKISVSPPTLASYTLFPEILRGEGEQYFKIPSNINKINLRLSLPKDAARYQTYRAVLQTADGDTAATVENLKNLNLELPAAKLENRTYVIRLEGRKAQNPAESIADYTFRVRR